MNNSSVTEINHKIIKEEHFNLCWKDNPPIQHLLDVISSVLADEYITVARQNPNVFLKHGDTK